MENQVKMSSSRFALRLACFGLIAAMALSGCDKPGDESSALAVVSGEKITEAQLEQTLARLMGAEHINTVDEAVRQNVLESMVLSRVIYQHAREKLDEEKVQALEAEIVDYREQLYIKAYLQQYAPPEPITSQMVRDYYESHPENFGGGTVHDFEMLSSVIKGDTGNRDELIKKLEQAKTTADWKALAGKLAASGLPLRYGRGRSDDKVLHERLQQALQSLQQGESSAVILLDGNPHILRVTAVETLASKPLESVSQDIRRSLVPAQLKKALDEVADGLLTGADIEYINPKEQSKGNSQ